MEAFIFYYLAQLKELKSVQSLPDKDELAKRHILFLEDFDVIERLFSLILRD